MHLWRPKEGVHVEIDHEEDVPSDRGHKEVEIESEEDVLEVHLEAEKGRDAA